MMAGLDGIQNKIHPGDPADKNLYDLPPEEDAKIPTVCSSLDRPWTTSTRIASS
jgi:glutamine synthetase